MLGKRYEVRPVLVALAASLFVMPDAASASTVGVFASTGSGFASPVSIVLRMDMRHGRLRSVVLAGDARCSTGGGTRISETLVAGRELRMRRNGDGRFAGVAEARGPHGDGSVRLVYRISGRLSRSGLAATGRLSASATWFDENGDRTLQCRRRAVRWYGTRAPGVLFAGATSQDEPVVLVRPVGASVVSMGFRWHTRSCSDGASRTPGSGVSYVRVVQGWLSESTTLWEPLDGGGDVFSRITLAGALVDSSGRGWYWAKLTLMYPDGSTITCGSGRLSWHVRTG